MSIYVVGDIQGCYEQLSRLLDKVNFDPAADRLWAVGDLVNRGPMSLSTLRLLHGLGDSLTAVLGNHDLHLLAIASDPSQQRQKDQLQEVLRAEDTDTLLHWLRHLPLAHAESLETQFGKDDYLMFHAGVAPGWSHAQVLSLAAEVETVLRGDDYQKFLAKMYGNRPDKWDDSLSGNKRLRLITNYLTRARFCKANGKLDLNVKTGINTAPPGYRPWFEHQRLSEDYVLLFGHWAALQGISNMRNVYALDTGCVWGRCLSMMRLEDRQHFSVSCQEFA